MTVGGVKNTRKQSDPTTRNHAQELTTLELLRKYQANVSISVKENIETLRHPSRNFFSKEFFSLFSYFLHVEEAPKSTQQDRALAAAAVSSGSGPIPREAAEDRAGKFLKL